MMNLSKNKANISHSISAKIILTSASYFQKRHGTAIAPFIILQEIEKVKELLAYGKQTSSDIAYQLGYSGGAALSSQFKKMEDVTGTA
jgi:AraC-like DNA-binding protein